MIFEVQKSMIRSKVRKRYKMVWLLIVSAVGFGFGLGSDADALAELVWRGVQRGLAPIEIGLGEKSYSVVVIEYSLIVGSCPSAAVVAVA